MKSREQVNSNMYSNEMSESLKKQSITYIENLPNELFYEIFDYLDGCDIYKAFLDLNSRFQHFFISLSFPTKINLSSESESELQHCYTHIVIPFKHQIRSLFLWNTLAIEYFLKEFNIDSSFNGLQCLLLHTITSDKLIPLLNGLISLPYFFSLVIHLHDNLNDLSDIYRLIFKLPFLKYNKLLFRPAKISILLPLTNMDQFSSVQYLVTNHYCTINDLIGILSFTPQLYRLSCKYLFQSDENIENETRITLFNLKHISISWCYVPYDILEMFIIKIASQLRTLCLRVVYMDSIYLDADRWQQLILQHIPYLDVFYFQYHEKLARQHSLTIYHTSLKQFTTSFWIERKWHFDLELDAYESEIIYLIRSYRDSTLYNHADINTYRTSDIHQKTINTLTQFTVHGVINCAVNRVQLSRYIESILNAAQVTCLKINCNISINSFLNMVHLIPDLDLLIVPSCAMLDKKELSSAGRNLLATLSNNSKITKVHIGQMTKIEHVQFLIDLCPRMQSLVIDCASSINIELLTRFILNKKVMHITKLCFLCLYIQQANDEIVQNLQLMIIREKLLSDYIIKRSNNIIYLQCNS